MVEKGGFKIKDRLQKNYPFSEEKCDGKCFPCESVQGKIDMKSKCKKTNIGYTIPCETCHNRGIIKVYKGESSRNAKIRGEEHLRGLKNGIEGNPLFKHMTTDHPNEEVVFKMQVKKHFKDPLTRLANEGVRIKNRKPEELLNSKSLFHQPSVVWLQVDRKKTFFKK